MLINLFVNCYLSTVTLLQTVTNIIFFVLSAATPTSPETTTETVTTTTLELTTTTTLEPTTTGPGCPASFTQTSQGCFYVETSASNRKSWDDAQTACQGFGSHVHLATVDTQQVCIVV